MIRVFVRAKPDRKTLQMYYVCPLTGKDITKSTRTDSRREAERRAATWEAEVNSRTVVNKDPSWAEFRKIFEDEVLAHKPPNTKASYSAAMNNWEVIVGKVTRLSLITPTVVSGFATKLGKQVKQTSVATNLRHIRAALRWAEGMELISRAPKIIMPKLGKRRLARSRAITELDYQAMLKAVPLVCPDDADVWKRFLELLWLSGLRINEAIGLSWTDPPVMVDLLGGKHPRILFFEDGQKSREDEIVIVPPDFAAWLQQVPANERVGPVVPVKSNQTYLRERASHVVSDIGKKADVKTGASKFASAHDFRRAFGQRWARVVKPLTLMKMMRHKTIQTTLAFYVDIEETDVAAELWKS